MISALTQFPRVLWPKLSDDEGQTLVEYSLIIALISLVILAAFQVFLVGVGGLITYIGDTFESLLGS